MKINLFVDDLVDIYSEKTGCDREKSQILIKVLFSVLILTACHKQHAEPFVTEREFLVHGNTF